MNDLFNALADPTRRAILAMLDGRQLPAGDIAAAFPQRRPAISKHLTILKRAGLIDEARDRQRRLYSIKARAFESVLGLIQDLHPPRPSGTTPRQVAAPVLPPAAAKPKRRAAKPASADFDLEFD